jgi:hypothetical protein
MGAGIAASPHCAERRICRYSLALVSPREGFNPASRSWLTSSGVASHPTTPPRGEPDRPTRLRGPKARWSFAPSGLSMRNSIPKNRTPPAKAVRCSAALLGVTALASRFAHRSRNPREETAIPGAASRERQKPLPAPSSRLAPPRLLRASTLPAGGDRFFCPFLPEGDWPLRRDWDVRPDHLSTMLFVPESGKRKIWVQACGYRGFR